jgi:hypothetical protein
MFIKETQPRSLGFLIFRGVVPQVGGSGRAIFDTFRIISLRAFRFENDGIQFYDRCVCKILFFFSKNGSLTYLSVHQ